MVEQRALSTVLGEFARTLVTDFPIQGILDHLVAQIVELLPVTAAGVTLISPGLVPRYVAASDDDALRFETLQTELQEGPCLAAYRTGEAVAVPDLEVDRRFPTFAPRAAAEGAAAIFTFPLRADSGRLGALDLYRDAAGALGVDDLAAAQTLADVTTAYLINAEARAEVLRVADRYRDSALHDALTGLPNRVLLAQRLEHAAQRAQRSRFAAAVLYIDLDEFKRVNDEYGHHVGDELLVAVARRMERLLRPGDTLARVGGDEFVILCEDMADASAAQGLSARLAEAFSDPFPLTSGEVRVTASVGVAFAGEAQAISPDLIVEADAAMLSDKRSGQVVARILDLRAGPAGDPDGDLARDLRTAFVQGTLDVAYQPVVRSSDARIVGLEALLRWTDAHRGPVAPRVAIATAERVGMIGEIGAWVLARACLDQKLVLAAEPGSSLDLSVNISATQLVEPGFTRTVAAILERTGMDPSTLVLEMTEDVLIEDPGRALTVLGDLKEMKVRLALDDFGTGYSSLTYLKEFPIDVVKIDREFVAAIEHTASSAIVRAVTNLAHELGMSVTAEGVETERQHRRVVQFGCESAQGFYYARPMPAPELAATLAAG